MKPKIKLINKSLVPHFSKLVDVSYATYKLIKKPNIGSIAGLASVFGKSAIELFAPDIFDGWMMNPVPKRLNTYIYETVKENGKFIKFIYIGESKYLLYNFLEIYILFYINTHDNNQIYCIMIHESDIEDFKQKINCFIWKNKHMLMRVDLKGEWDQTISLYKDDLYSPLPTLLGEQVFESCKKYYAKNKKRSIMFLGPPGTGKSSMAKFVSYKLNMKTLRIMGDTLVKIDIYSIKEIFDYVKPQCVIIEDMDKIKLEFSILEFFELMKKDVEFMFLTVNRADRLEQSLVRPGRIDDFIVVDKAEDEIILSVLGEENKDLFDVVQDWPIAYIQDLKTRIQVLGEERVLDVIKELSERMKIFAYTDDECDNNEDEYSDKHEFLFRNEKTR